MERKSIEAIKEILINTEITQIPNVCNSLYDDRASVKKLCDTYLKKYNNYITELKRLEEISYYEKLVQSEGYSLIGGVDEVGRGPLAGPVVASCVILKPNSRILGINDSKKLSAKKREELSEIIKNEAISYGIGVVSAEVIDDINILMATYEAMRAAISAMKITPDYILNDAVTIPRLNIPQKPIIKGDAKSMSIGAASIIAKVYRDGLMDRYSEEYPEYGFNTNKGYGSASHISAIKEFGICPVHRKTFVKGFVEV